MFSVRCMLRVVTDFINILYILLYTCSDYYSSCSGLFSCIMRDMANMTSDSPKWIVLDGDIDPMWIESLNTVMDDNKVC